MGFVEDAGGQRGLAQIFNGLLADFTLEAGIDGDEEASGALVDVGLLVVEGDGEELRGWQVDVDGPVAHADLLRCELAEVNAGDGLTVDFEKDFVSGEKGGQDAVLAIAGDQLIHRVRDGLEAREPADLHDDRGLRGVDAESAGAEGGGDAIPDAVFRLVEKPGEDGRAEEKACEKPNDQDGPETAPAHGWRRNRRHA